MDITKYEGLSSTEVQRLTKQGKTNYVKKTVGKSYAAIIFDNVLTMFNLVGIVVFILLAVAGEWSNTFFMVVILANTLVGIVQEVRAKLTVQKLSLMTAPTAYVVRDGKAEEIAVNKLVPGDVILLKTGKQIPADSELIDGFAEANEALLTGESKPVRKDTGDMLLSGSFVVSGECAAKVVHIGAENYVEQLAIKAKKYKKPKSELMRSINSIIKIVAIIVFPLGIASFLTGFYGQNEVWTTALAYACGSMIGMIPSGMVLLTSVTLAVSVLKMVRKKALVQDLYCIEMLARVNVLCLDKTGTITDGTMTVEDVISFDDGADIASAVLSILKATHDQNDTAQALKKHFDGKIVPSSETLPFSSDRKFSAAVLGDEIFFLGAGEFILKGKNERIEKLAEEYSQKGMRALILAKSGGSIKEPENIRPVALIALSDTLRKDAKEIVGWFAANDVAMRVISGDNAETVSVIAQKAGVPNADKFVSADKMSDEELVEAAVEYTVFGRVTPDQKAVLIRAIKSQGNTVAMTGDGVNDILAMKQADCAVAVASGSEAARSVAHLVLMDSSFSSMPDVVKEGRQVVNNIQNSTSLFLMKTIMMIFTTLLTLILGRMPPFQPKNLYVIEVFVIGIPAFFLALRTNDSLIKGSFLRNIFSSTLPKGLALAVCVAAVYIFEKFLGISGDANVLTMTVMLAVTYAGIAGLFVLCAPYTKISLAVALGSLFLSTAAFWVFDRLSAAGFWIFGELDYGLEKLNPTLLLFLAAVVILSAAIMTAGKIIETKKKKEIENAKIS